MTPQERLAAINIAQSIDELSAAMDGYLDDAIGACPSLERCAGFKKCIEAGTFTHAQLDLDAYAAKTGEDYSIVKPVVAAAADKQVALGGQAPYKGPTRVKTDG